MNISQSNSLTVLWSQLRMNLNGAEQSERDWQDQIHAAGLVMLEIRNQFPNDIEFGKQYKENNIKLNHQDRAALIKMAREPDRFRRVLTNTKSRSIQLIYKNEWRFTSASKPEETKSKHKLRGEREQRVADAVLDRGKTLEDAASEFGLDSVQVVKIAVAKEEGRREAANDPVIDADALPKTAKAKLEAAIRQHKHRLDREFDMRMREEVRVFINKHILPEYAERLRKADIIIASNNFMNRWPLSPSQYKQILGALHPDANLSPEKKSELFQMFKAKEKSLKSPVDHEERLAKGGLPRTVEELMERARKKKEADAAKRAAKKGGS
jgi:hypothetical protein